jgi:hypothetical protein
MGTPPFDLATTLNVVAFQASLSERTAALAPTAAGAE